MFKDAKDYDMSGRELNAATFKHSPESRANLVASNIGKVLSEETRKRMSKAAKGRKQSPEHKAKRTKPKYTFQGKGANDWAKILNGDAGVIREHIKNGTMHEYKTYCEWANIPCNAINKNVKVFYKGKTVRQWATILGGDPSIIREHIKNGTMHEYKTYCAWANIPYTKKTAIKYSFQGKTVKQWAEILGGDKGTIRDNIANGTMQQYIEKKTKGTSCNLQ